MGRPLEKTRMYVENITRERLSARRPEQEKREFAITSSMVGQIIVNNQHVTARFHEIFCDAGGGVGGDIGEARGIIALRYNDHAIFHCTFVAQLRDDLGHRGCPLANCAVDAEHVLTALVYDGIDGNGRFPGLAIAEDQFALPPPDGDHRIDYLPSSL